MTTGIWCWTVLALSSSVTGQSTWYVDVQAAGPGIGTQADPFVGLQQAIDAPSTLSGDKLQVLPGTYAERINFLGKSLDIESSSGAGATLLDGSLSGSAGSVVTVDSGEDSGTRLAGFTVTGGEGTNLAGFDCGGGVLIVGATIELADCRLENNRAWFGAGLYAESATLTVSACSFSDNVLPFDDCEEPWPAGGGAYLSDVDFVFDEITLARNLGLEGRGAGLYARESTGSWIEGLVEENQSGGDVCFGEGGGLFLEACDLQMEDVLLRRNLAFGSGALGGAVLAESGSVRLLDCVFENNRAGEALDQIMDIFGSGGAVWATAALVVRDCEFTNNLAFNGGGAIQAGDIDARDCFFSGNTSEFGGAFNGSGLLLRCNFMGNFASSRTGSMDFGGAVYGFGSNTQLVRCDFEKNEAFGPGGAVYNADLRLCNLLNNRACDGGAAYRSTLEACLLLENEGRTSGGALDECTAVGCVIAFNKAGLRGGGAENSELDRCTLYGNFATGINGCGSFFTGNELLGTGAGGGVSGSTVTNSILWNNAPDEVANPVIGFPFEPGPSQLDYCDVAGGFAQGVGNIDIDPLFWQPQASNFYLQSGSPCIDAGNPNQMDPDGSALDMGAFPFEPNHCPTATTFCTAKINSLGCTPEIAASGVLDGIQPLLISASMVLNQKAGLFFYGLNGRAEQPFFGGTLCAQPPLRRTALQNSGGSPASTDDCSGSYAFDLSSWLANGSDSLLTTGTTLVGQFWSRDPNLLSGTGLTDAVEVVVCQ